MKDLLDAEWVELILQAKKDGFSVEELQEFFRNKETIIRNVQNEYNKVTG